MSPRAACRLETLGFDQVFDYTTGLADWTANALPTAGELTTILTAKDVARRDAPTCLLTDRIGDVATRVRSSEHNQCIVISSTGVVLGRLRGRALDGTPNGTAESVMESGPSTIRPDVLLEEYTDHMRSRRVGSTLVTNTNGELIGVLYRSDAEARLAELGG